MPKPVKKISEINFGQAPTAVVFGRVTYPPGGVHGPRRSRGIQVFCIERGEARVSVDGRVRYVGPQQASLFLPGSEDVFRFARSQESEHTWCTLSFGQVRLPEAGLQALAALPTVVPTTQALDELIATGLRLSRSLVATSGMPLLRLGEAVLEAYRDAPQAGGTTPLPMPVDKAVRWMQEHHTERVDMAQAAQAAGVTVNHLTRLFDKHLGHTPARYLWRLREERAVGLLRDTGLSVGEIADRTGFASPFHLSRRIRHRYGLSPRALRAQMWDAPE